MIDLNSTSSFPGFWILISTIITVLAPLAAKYFERIIISVIERGTTIFNIQNKWKYSVQLISLNMTSQFAVNSTTNAAYKAVMYHLMGLGPLNHVRQIVGRANDYDDDNCQNNDFINRDLNFLATGYNKSILIDSDNEIYIVPTFEQESFRETTTKINILNVVSNKTSTTAILNIISEYQIQYLDYIKRYNKDGKLKYIKLKTFSKDNTKSITPPGHKSDRVRDALGEIFQNNNEDSCKRTPSWSITDFISSKSFTNVFFPQKESIINQIDNFIDGEDFYRQRGIPWNLCILLHGVPGCGKTSFIKALANKTKRHLLDINLSTIKTTQDFTVAFNTDMFVDNFIPMDKRIVVLEDIDCMNSGFLRNRQDIAPDQEEYDTENKMNLSCFLNMLDGIQEHHGRILIATTNCIDKLDHAVLRRFNVKVNFTHLNQDTAQSIVNNYYDDVIPLPTIIPMDLTGAALTQLCMLYQNDPQQLVNALKAI